MDKREGILIGVLAVLSVYLLAPFADAIIFGIVTAYGLKVLVRRLRPYLKNRFWEALLIFGVFAVILGGIYFMLNSTATMAYEFLRLTSGISEGLESVLETYNFGALSVYVSQASYYINSFIRENVFTVASHVPSFLLQVFTYFVVVYFAYTEGGKVYRVVDEFIHQLPPEDASTLLKIRRWSVKLVKDVFIVYGTHSVILGIIAAIGFYLLGQFTLGYPLPFWWFWAIMVTVAAFLPGIASGVFLGPIILYYFMIGQFWFAFWMTVFSITFLWLFAELVLRPWIGTSKINESYLVILVGFVAGVLVFGLNGIILGPIVIITAKNLLMERLEEQGVIERAA